jgi:hypothetical protein
MLAPIKLTYALAFTLYNLFWLKTLSGEPVQYILVKASVRGEPMMVGSSSVWSNRFIASAIFQGAVITLLTASFIGMQLLFSSVINIIQLLSLSFEGPAKWIFLGYIYST